MAQALLLDTDLLIDFLRGYRPVPQAMMPIEIIILKFGKAPPEPHPTNHYFVNLPVCRAHG